MVFPNLSLTELCHSSYKEAEKFSFLTEYVATLSKIRILIESAKGEIDIEWTITRVYYSSLILYFLNAT